MKKIFLVALVLVGSLMILIIIFGKTTFNYRGPKVENTFTKSNFNTQYYNSEDLLLINVWATWCAPCIAEIPVLEKIEAANKKLKWISISLDEDTIRLKKFLHKYPVLNSRDIALNNFQFRDSIFEKIKLVDPIIGNSIIKLNSRKIPYVVLIKNKKILYKTNDSLDVKLLQSIITQN